MNPTKKLFLLATLILGVMTCWRINQKLDLVTDQVEVAIDRALSTRVSMLINNFSKKTPDFEELSSDTQNYIGVGIVNCDVSFFYSKVSLVIEGERYQKIVSNTGRDFPAYRQYLAEQGFVKLERDWLTLIAEGGKTFQRFPLKILKRGEDIFKAVLYFGRPMNGVFCKKDQRREFWNLTPKD